MADLSLLNPPVMTIPELACLRAALSAQSGTLIYAVGDIHGRSDLLKKIIAEIAGDIFKSGVHFRPTLMFLGDYIDRGPASKQVISDLIAIRAHPDLNVVCLMGNHEAMLLDVYNHGKGADLWLKHGGAETLKSYGIQVDPDAPAPLDLRLRMRRAVPAEHIAFLRSLPLMAVIGDHIFVHAGLRAGVALENQKKSDLLWSRLNCASVDAPGKTIVHGHTPVDQPLHTEGRICVDTGAYMTGRLTAVRIANGRVSFLTTEPHGRFYAEPRRWRGQFGARTTTRPARPLSVPIARPKVPEPYQLVG